LERAAGGPGGYQEPGQDPDIGMTGKLKKVLGPGKTKRKDPNRGGPHRSRSELRRGVYGEVRGGKRCEAPEKKKVRKN